MGWVYYLVCYGNVIWYMEEALDEDEAYWVTEHKQRERRNMTFVKGRGGRSSLEWGERRGARGTFLFC